MNKYNVFITTSQYELVEANSAAEAQMIAYKQWLDGKIEIDIKPEFICEEADIEEEDEDEKFIKDHFEFIKIGD